MARNPDPKPGRWILPLIIVGMVGFTYLFTNSIETVPEVPDNEASSSSSTTSTSTPETDSTTPTTVVQISPEVQAYVAGLDNFELSMVDLGTRMTSANTAWDDRTANYSDTKTAFQALITETTTLADEIAAAAPPAGEAELALEHEGVVTAATAAKTAAENVLDGLVNSEGSAERIAAVAAFNTAVGDFSTAVTSARSIAGAS